MSKGFEVGSAHRRCRTTARNAICRAAATVRGCRLGGREWQAKAGHRDAGLRSISEHAVRQPRWRKNWNLRQFGQCAASKRSAPWRSATPLTQQRPHDHLAGASNLGQLNPKASETAPLRLTNAALISEAERTQKFTGSSGSSAGGELALQDTVFLNGLLRNADPARP